MNKILIIKRTSDDFDRFVCESIRTEKDNIDVIDAFRFHGKIGRKIIKIIKKKNLDMFLPFFLNISINSIKQYETIILFDDYPDLPLIKWIRKKNEKCYLKLWLWNVPDYPIDKYREYCKIYCFDSEYCKRNHINFINQFYFNKIVKEYSANSIDKDIVYVGADKDRKAILNSMAEEFERLGIRYDIKLIMTDRDDKDKSKEGFTYLTRPLKYKEVLSINARSSAILELVQENQMGLTWRALECLYMEKKMITNNMQIKEYDFYDRNNIFIYGHDDIDQLRQFLRSSYIKQNEQIIKKYSFDNWFKQIMEWREKSV